MTCWYWYVATSQWPLPPEVGIKFLTGKMYGAQLRWTEVAPDNTHAHCRQAQETKKSHFYLYKRHKVLLCFAIFSCFKKSIKTAASYMTPLISLYILTSLGVQDEKLWKSISSRSSSGCEAPAHGPELDREMKWNVCRGSGGTTASQADRWLQII